MSSVSRRISRTKRDASLEALAIHVTIDRMLTDDELRKARRDVPAHIARSARRSREWHRRIEQRLAVPEHVRRAFMGAL